MRKKICLLLLCLLFSLSCLFSPTKALESTVYVRKHVSILYDNSGSMSERLQGTKNLKWSYASYAAQVFTGLLNETDTLSVTFMKGDALTNLYLHGLRQDAVNAVLDRTSVSNGDTPISQIGSALSVLENEGLKLGSGTNTAGEQYWLVLTTDGVFRENGQDLEPKRVAQEIEAIMKRYPDLHMVYFGIGTQYDTSNSKAVDFRQGSGQDQELLDRLHAFQNFTALYAETQEQIVETMQSISNTISGRYSVPDAYEVSGQQLRLHLSGEGSPIRNIALMAQETDARLVSAVAEDGTELGILREAQIRYPKNTSYDNMEEGTKGGYVALIACSSGEKVPSGDVVLNFSEPINADSIALMYEPAIYIRLLVEYRMADGQWEAVPEYADLVEGDEIRIGYRVCEDGSDKELDTARLFGKTDARILYDGAPLTNGEILTVTSGDHTLDAHVSMMDGGYEIGNSRTLRVGVPKAEDISVLTSGPIELVRAEAAENTEQHVDFTLLFRSEPVDEVYAAKATLKVIGEEGELKGSVEKPSTHVLRFIPHDDGCKTGTYVVHLLYEGEEAASELITILPNPTTYSAEAGQGISIMSNHTADNDSAVTFQVVAHRDAVDEPITAEETGMFTVKAEGPNGTVAGVTEWKEGGVAAFTLRDPSAFPGDYSVSLWLGGEKLAETSVTVLRHDAQYEVEAIVSDPDTVDRFKLHKNTACVSFVVYEDGVPCSAEQLEGMLASGYLTISTDLASRFVRIARTTGLSGGSPALICTPVSSTKNPIIRFFRHMLISFGVGGLARDDFEITAKVDMLHGAEASGRLDLVGYNPIYPIIAIGILALIVLSLMVFIANGKAIRMKKGRIWSFEVTERTNALGDTIYSINAVSSVSVGKTRFMLLPVNESLPFQGLTFSAAASKQQTGRKQSKWFRHSNPEARISGRVDEVARYQYHQPKKALSQLLDNVKDFKLHDAELSKLEFNTLVDAPNSLVTSDIDRKEPGKRIERSLMLQRGTLLFRAIDGKMPYRYTFWWFNPEDKRADGHTAAVHKRGIWRQNGKQRQAGTGRTQQAKTGQTHRTGTKKAVKANRKKR